MESRKQRRPHRAQTTKPTCVRVRFENKVTETLDWKTLWHELQESTKWYPGAQPPQENESPRKPQEGPWNPREPKVPQWAWGRFVIFITFSETGQMLHVKGTIYKQINVLLNWNITILKNTICMTFNEHENCCFTNARISGAEVTSGSRSYGFTWVKNLLWKCNFVTI